METYIAIEDIDSGSEGMVIVRTPRATYVGVHTGANASIGQASEALPRGRKVQLGGFILSLTEDERVYNVPFTLTP